MMDLSTAMVLGSFATFMMNVFVRKVGGIWFLRIGRLRVSFCMKKVVDLARGDVVK